MGWLKERIERDRRFKAEVPKVWEQLVESIQLAVGEWKEHGAADVIFRREREGCVVLVKETTNEKCEIFFNSLEPCVTCTGARGANLGASSLAFAFGSDGQVWFYMDGKPIDVQMACRLLTESFFLA
jgi:hypothetical protein